MTAIKVDIVTAEQLVYSEDVDVVIVPGVDGEMAILPSHAPLMTMIKPGELRLKTGAEEILMAVTGGFLEVRPDRITIMADAAERAEDIDISRAEAAKRRAEERLKGAVTEVDTARAEASLRRSLIRLQVVQKRKRKRPEIN